MIYLSFMKKQRTKSRTLIYRMNEKKTIKKLNNGGFSLIEVLVAVIIFALVTGPILMAFVMSARFNSRARTHQDVNTVAESFMEEFKGSGIENIKNNISAYNFNDVSVNGSGEYTFSAKNYDFIGAKYDVRVMATPTISEEVVDMDPITSDRDFVFIQDLNYDKFGFEFLYGEVYGIWNAAASFGPEYPAISEADKKDYITVNRVINVNVTTDISNAKTVTVVYDYNYSVAPYTDVSPSGDIINIPAFTGSLSSSVSWAPKPGTNYTKTFPADKPLNRIFICYSPGYESASEARIYSDTFNITSAGSNKVYILKQQNPYLSGNLSFMEANYRVSVNGTNYYHNFDINMSTGAYDSTLSVKPFCVQSKSLYMNPSEDVVKDKKLMYDLKVEVYEAGAYGSFNTHTPIYTLNGSMNSD